MMIQIPDVHLSTFAKAKGRAKVLIRSRTDPRHTGEFSVAIDMKFDPATDQYPNGTLEIDINLSDSVFGRVTSTTVEQLSYTGKHNPTVFATGRCHVQSREVDALSTECRYWLMMANNKEREQNLRSGTPDIISFLIYDRAGIVIAYGTGPALEGDIEVTAR